MPQARLKKRKDGRYRCKLGNRVFYGQTEREAKEARARFQAETMQGLNPDEHNTTVDEYAQRWLPVYRAESCEKSYRLYGKILDGFILFTNNAKMKSIKKSTIVAYYNTLSDYSPSHIGKHVDTITGLFSAAKEDGLIWKDPTVDVKPPSGVEGRYAHRAIEQWERSLIHDMLDVEYKAAGKKFHGHPFAPAVMGMLYQGMRKGEVLAFDIDRDVDFENGRVYIREALSFSETHRGLLKDPKTKQGVRDMPLFEPFRQCIEGKHGKLVKAANGGKVTESVFTSMWKSYKYQMGVLHNNGLSKRWDKDGRFEPITIRTHDFRHSFCTMICEAGVDVKTAMAWMGHSDAKMIQQIYDHLTKERERQAEKNTAKMIDEKIGKMSLGVQKRVQNTKANSESVEI